MPNVTVVAVDLDEVITATARLLCNARVSQSEADKRSFQHAAEEFAKIFGIAHPRIVERAKVIMAMARQECERELAGRN